MNAVALITDYGLSDWYAGEMKGAMLSACPEILIVDITHGIPPGDIKRAAFTLATCFRTFPPRTVFCVVVDPGVGSSRKAIAAHTGSYFFVGPDNGVLSWAFSLAPPASVRIIQNRNFYSNISEVSSTFHGRDIFGPVSARLAAGAKFSDIGAETADYVMIPFPKPTVSDSSVIAEILATDRFGNIITAIDASLRQYIENKKIKIRIGKASPVDIAFGNYFQSVPCGELLCYFGSAGYLEIGINGANAAEKLGVGSGEYIEILLQ